MAEDFFAGMDDLEDMADHSRSLQTLERLLEVSQAINAILDLDELLRQIMVHAVEVAGAERGFLMLLDEVGQLHFRAVRRMSDAEATAVKREVSRTIIQEAVSSRQPLRVVHAAANDRFADRRSVIDLGLKSVLCAPLMVKETVIGVIYLDHRSQVDAFSEADLDTLQTFGNLAAVAIQNARLFEQVQRHATELEQRVAERTAELRAANDRLLELDRLKDQFVVNINHELRTPLANIKLYLELLRIGRPEKRDLYLLTLRREEERLESLIEDLLQISRLDLAMSSPRLIPTDLNLLVDIVLTDRERLATQRGLTLRAELAPDLPPVLANAQMIDQVLTNLVTNALSYTGAGGTVTLRTAAAPDGVVFYVSDTGPGIPQEEQQHLFDRFFRGQAAYASGVPGTGLGLAICQEIVDRHGGRITVESSPGQGSTFTVWLPRAPTG